LTLMSLAGLVVVAFLIYRRMMGPANLVAQVRARQEAQARQRRALGRAGNPMGGGTADAE